MHYSVYAGLGFAALFGAVGPGIARQVSPAIATWLMSIGGLLAALSGACALALLGMTLIGQSPAVASAGHWSITALRHSDPVRWPIAIGALAALAVGLARLTWVSTRRTAALIAAYRLNRSVEDSGSDLVVVDAEQPDAYAVPGRPGRVFVTRGMLRLLTRDECDVVLAHERSHLRHHHHWHRSAALLASALNPLLLSLPRTQHWLTERWADEDAARRTDRALVASALSRAAGERSCQRPGLALALGPDAVERRVEAMRSDPPRPHLLMVAVLVVIIGLSVSGTFDGFTDEAHLFHAALLGHYAHLRPLRHATSR